VTGWRCLRMNSNMLRRSRSSNAATAATAAGAIPATSACRVTGRE
jgi:hypothetical protein